jgi:peroxiredoxin Q/BCP
VSGVRIGELAPDLTLEDQDGRYRSLSEFQGQPLLIFFYPRTAAGECTPDACALRDALARLSQSGVRVVGISTDDAFAHRAYREANRLPFDLLSDPDEIAATAYGVPSEMGFITARELFLLDAEGKLVDRWLNLSDVAEVLAAIDALPPTP